jgi:phage terminase large subunit-like protein
VGYEQYGMQSDIEHIKYEMELRNYRFNIVEIGGSLAKEDRIKRLVPICEQRRFYLPETLHFVNYEAKVVDYVHEFIENEYTAFPVCVHDDMMDCLARIVESNLGATFPTPDDSNNDDQRSYDYGSSTGWMS